MTQTEIRELAKRISAERGVIAVATTVRPTPNGYVFGGWTSKEDIWVVREYGTDHILAGLPTGDGTYVPWYCTCRDHDDEGEGVR